MTSLTCFFLGVLGLPFLILLARVWLNRRAARRLREGCHLGRRVILEGPESKRYTLPKPRGDSLLETLAALLACGCMAAVLVACCMDGPEDVDAVWRGLMGLK